MITEVWKTIEEFPGYEVSNLGRVRNRGTMRVRKFRWREDQQRLSLELRIPGDRRLKDITVQILVYETFVGPLNKGEYVRFKDGDPKNCAVSNLVIRRHPSSKLSWNQLLDMKRQIIECHRSYGYQSRIARRFDITVQTLVDLDKTYRDEDMEELERAAAAERLQAPGQGETHPEEEW
jgi:hypothetical protein